MKKLIFFAILIGIFVYQKQGSKSGNNAGNSNTSVAAIDVGHGFVSVFMPDGSSPNEAYVLSPINCTSAEVAIGNKLADDLEAAGISAKRSESFRVHVENATDEQNAAINKSTDLLNSGDPPIVFINGYGKARPSVDEVLAVYNQTK
jgi:hypothetical protein